VVDLRLEGEELAALVRFVDYGTEQWCAAGHELRKELFATEVPVQAVALRLVGARPVGGRWGKEALDILHAMVVDQEVEVVLERLGTSTATITLAATGEDVAELLRGSCSSVV